jgi:hypothetical protein
MPRLRRTCLAVAGGQGLPGIDDANAVGPWHICGRRGPADSTGSEFVDARQAASARHREPTCSDGTLIEHASAGGERFAREGAPWGSPAEGGSAGTPNDRSSLRQPAGGCLEPEQKEI